ncbi:hypothetical protein FNO01nite_33470 [Flavobacterium noncentrifugens]|uniref:Tellurite resistance protein TerB n=1 Tax=Flavobacterium noncentrifugens TaxID=1128970 RepID=A0A1G8Y620_9FLAO|nr:hypothetical protein FNO01nite_33470 [Flavobacterium noncentrifugens]SDJ98278.1 hypothetical protein SAMN04487935_2205 [Flavobacterium noncentrifugens]
MDSNVLTIQLKSHFLRLYQMALTDDNFNVLEMQMLYFFADERGIPKEELEKLFVNPVSYEPEIPVDLHTRIEYLYDLTRIIWADEKITDDEMNTLKKYCKKFEFLDENIDDLANYLIDCVKTGVQKQDIFNQLNA